MDETGGGWWWGCKIRQRRARWRSRTGLHSQFGKLCELRGSWAALSSSLLIIINVIIRSSEWNAAALQGPEEVALTLSTFPTIYASVLVWVVEGGQKRRHFRKLLPPPEGGEGRSHHPPAAPPGVTRPSSGWRFGCSSFCCHPFWPPFFLKAQRGAIDWTPRR